MLGGGEPEEALGDGDGEGEELDELGGGDGEDEALGDGDGDDDDVSGGPSKAVTCDFCITVFLPCCEFSDSSHWPIAIHRQRNVLGALESATTVAQVQLHNKSWMDSEPT